MDATDFIVLLGLGGGFAVMAGVELVKRTADLPERIFKRCVPLLALLLGFGWNWLVLSVLRAEDTRWTLVLFLGIESALSSLGMWSGTSSVKKSFEQPADIPANDQSNQGAATTDG